MSEGVAGPGVLLVLPLADSDRTPAAPVSLVAIVQRSGSLFRLADGRPVYRLKCHWSYQPGSFRVRLRGRRAYAARALLLVHGETITLRGRWRNRVFYADRIVR